MANAPFINPAKRPPLASKNLEFTYDFGVYSDKNKPVKITIVPTKIRNRF